MGAFNEGHKTKKSFPILNFRLFAVARLLNSIFRNQHHYLSTRQGIFISGSQQEHMHFPKGEWDGSQTGNLFFSAIKLPYQGYFK
jgi:hypothetical protein